MRKYIIIIIILIFIDIGFFIFGYAQMTIAKKQTWIAIHQKEIADQCKIEADSAMQKIISLHKIIDHQDSLITDLKKLLNVKGK